MGTWAETLDALVRERGGALYGYAFVLTGDKRAANDLMHHSLVHAFRRAPRNMPVGAAHAYVKRAMQLRSYAMRALHARSAAAKPGPDGTDAFAPDYAAASGTGPSLHEAILSLPPRERTCAVMRYFDGLGVGQIARELDLEPDAVRAHLSRAASALAARHADLGFAPEDLGDGDRINIVVEIKDTGR